MIVTKKHRDAAIKIYDALAAAPNRRLGVSEVKKVFWRMSDKRHTFVSSSFRILKELDIARSGTLNQFEPRANGIARNYYVVANLPRRQVERLIQNFTPPR